MKEWTELSTVLDMIRFGMSRCYEAEIFLGHGTDSMWDEVLELVLHALHLPRDTNPVILHSHVTTLEKAAIHQLIDKRITERKPTAYLINQAWFAGLPFYVDERVIIPRSPMAELIEKQFSPWIEENNVSTILDLCTGSGCIAITCALAFPEAAVDAVDISNDALVVAQRNCVKHNVEEQVALIQSDLFSNLPKKHYDVIISNPPYVSEAEMRALPKEYWHEPDIALRAGQDGLDFVEKILRHAKNYLSPHGILIVEVGNSADALVEKYPDAPFTWLTFERSEDGVFLLTREQLNNF